MTQKYGSIVTMDDGVKGGYGYVPPVEFDPQRRRPRGSGPCVPLPCSSALLSRSSAWLDYLLLDGFIQYLFFVFPPRVDPHLFFFWLTTPQYPTAWVSRRLSYECSWYAFTQSLITLKCPSCSLLVVTGDVHKSGKNSPVFSLFIHIYFFLFFLFYLAVTPNR